MTNSIASPPVDPTTGQNALAQIRPRLDAFPPESVSSPNFDVQAAVVAALSLARFVRDPAVYARFAALPKSELDPTCIDDVELGAAALWYAHAEWLDAGVTATDARLPISLAQRGAELRARMLRLLDYFFEDDPAVAPEVADIRSGSGYLDLATDLTRLAKLYAAHKDVIEHDVKHYRASDANDAQGAARAILVALGEHAGGQDWANVRNRAWTFLVTAVDEVRAAGAFLFRTAPDLARFAPLRTMAGVVNPGRPRKKRAEPTTNDVEPGVV